MLQLELVVSAAWRPMEPAWKLLYPSPMMQIQPSKPMPLREARAEFDRVYLARLLASTEGDVTRAAEIAEIHPKSFARLMRRYKLNKQ